MNDSRRTLLLFLCSALISSIPLCVLFFDSFRAIAHGAGVLATACSVAILLPGLFLLFRYAVHLRKAARYVVVAVAGTAMISLWMNRNEFPIASSVDVLYSDGSRSGNVRSAPSTAWGRSMGVYFLHPAYGSVRVPETLIAKFSTHPSAVRIWVAKPREALLLSDDRPTPSDGISLQVTALDPKGRNTQTRVVNVSQAEFLGRHWISELITAPTGISEVSVRVTAGPPGSTPDYDSTLVAIEVLGERAYLLAVGKLLLGGLAAAVIALVLLPHRKPRPGSPTSPTSQRQINILTEYALPIGLFSSVVLLVVYWSASRTSFVYFWDTRNYWAKTETLYELMKSGSWNPFAHAILAANSSDYSMLPAILPALISLPFGYPSRLVYALTITAVYVVPAFLLVAYLAARLIETDAVKSPYRGYNLVFSALAPLCGFPLFLAVAVHLMPDIGGVIVVIGATLLATQLTRMVGTRPENTGYWPPPDLVRASLGFGVLLCVMFLFRRWYVFAAGGIVLAGMLVVAGEMWQNKDSRRSIMARTLVAMILTGVAVLALLAPVMFDWARSFEEHDYARLYSSYTRPLTRDLQFFISKFGFVAPALAIVFGLLVYPLKLNRRLLFILFGSAAIACVLFLQVQSPGPHHYYLLMPLLGAGLAGISQVLGRKRGLGTSLAFSAALLLGGISATANLPQNGWLTTVFPDFKDWTPKQQPGIPALRNMGEWLLSPDIKSRKFCLVASSERMNESLLDEIWQIAPSVPKNSFSGRIAYLGNVDSRDGAPWESIKQCEIALVGSPLQTVLPDGEQYSVQILQEDLINATGIGIAYERLPETFAIDERTTVLAFRRTRELTNDEYRDLVTRFYRKKSTQAGIKEPL